MLGSHLQTVNNVGISNFEFTDGTNSFGVIKSVVVYNSTFETAGDSTDYLHPWLADILRFRI